MNSSVTIIIPTFNQSNLLHKCLLSLERQIYRSFSVHVIDNASTDDTAQMIKQFHPEVELTTLKKNWGFSRAVNIGIQSSTTPYIFLLNNDIELHETALNHLTSRIESESPHCGGIQCRLMIYNSPEIIDTLGISLVHDQHYKFQFKECFLKQKFDPLQHQQGRIFGLCAGAALYRSAFFKDIGIFDERFFAQYEDVDLSLRGLRKGWYYVTEPLAWGLHHRSLTVNTMGYTKTLEIKKNYYLSAYKNFPAKLHMLLHWRLLYDVQKDFFNIVSLIRKKQFWITIAMYIRLFRLLPAIFRERDKSKENDLYLTHIFNIALQKKVWSVQDETKKIKDFGL